MNLDALRECAAKGMTQAEASRALGECRKRISDFARRYGITFRDGKAELAARERLKRGTAEKEELIRKMLRAGATNAEIAAATEYTVESVKKRVQIMRQRGEDLPVRNGQARATAAVVARRRAREAMEQKAEAVPKVPGHVAAARAAEDRRQRLAEMARRAEEIMAKQRAQKAEAAGFRQRAAMAKRAEVIIAAAPRPVTTAPQPQEPAPGDKPIGGNLTRHDFFDWRHKRPVAPPQTGVERIMDAHLAEIGVPDGWPAEHDAVLVTALFGRGLKIDAAAAVLGVTKDAALTRFKDLVLPLRGPTGALPTEAGRLVAEAIARRDAFTLSAPGHADRVSA